MPYIGRSLGDGVRARYIYAATSGQTTFSGNDANGIALAYSDTLYMDVYQNGVLLKPVTDYASTTGTSVVLTTGASTSDVVEMIVYDSFAVADTVSAVNGGTFSSSVAFSGGATFPDSAELAFGASSDFKISHNGSKTKLEDTGTGNLEIRGTNIEFYSGDGGETLAKLTDDGAVELYHNNSKKIETTSTGVSVTGNVTVASGNGIDFAATSDSSGTTSSELFADYEEGTFTPSIGGSGVVYGTASGHYRKIGNFVFVYLQITISTIGSPATTNSIQGLPFAPALSNQHFGVAYYDGITNNTYELHGNFRSDSSIRMEGKTSFGGGQNSGHGWAQNGAAIYGSGSYYTA